MVTFSTAEITAIPTINLDRDPWFLISNHKDDNNLKLIMELRIDEVRMGVVALAQGRWVTTPASMSYEDVPNLERDIQFLSEIYTGSVSHSYWKGSQVLIGIPLNNEEDILVVRGGGMHTRLGIADASSNDEMTIRVGDESDFADQCEKIISVVGRILVEGSVSQHYWRLLKTHFSVGIDRFVRILDRSDRHTAEDIADRG